MGGGIFVVVALTPYGGWFKEAKEWMSRVAHTGDKVPHCAWVSVGPICNANREFM